MTGEDYEAARPVPARSGVTGDPWRRSGVTGDPWRRSEVIAYLATPIDAHYLRTLLIGLDATVSVNDDGVLVIETPDVPTVRTSGQTTTTTAKAAFAAFKEWESDEDQQYDHLDPCDCDDCRRIAQEPPVGSVVRCTGCGNVYIHKPHGWLNTDDGSTSPSLEGIKRPSCGPLRVIYTPKEDK